MRILVIKPSSLGDIIHTLPAVRIIKKNFPACHISWLIFDRFKQLAELFSDVDELIIFKRFKWAKVLHIHELVNFLRQYRRLSFDYVIDFQGLLRSGILTFLANSPRKIGFADAREFSSRFYKQKIHVSEVQRHAVEKNIDLVNKIFCLSETYSLPSFKSTSECSRKAQELLHKFGLRKKDFLVAVAPTSRWISKTWPDFFFLRLSRMY